LQYTGHSEKLLFYVRKIDDMADLTIDSHGMKHPVRLSEEGLPGLPLHFWIWSWYNSQGIQYIKFSRERIMVGLIETVRWIFHDKTPSPS
jgi:hypothetical protein